MITHRELFEKELHLAKEHPEIYGDPIENYNTWLESKIPIPRSMDDPPTECCDILVYRDAGWAPSFYMAIEGLPNEFSEYKKAEFSYWIPVPDDAIHWKDTLDEMLKEHKRIDEIRKFNKTN